MLQTAPHLTAHVLESDRRKLERNDISLDTQMCDRNNNTFDARVMNVSNGGFMAQTAQSLIENDLVRIQLPTIGWVRADVVWVLGDRVGARFRDPIADHALTVFNLNAA